MKGKIYLLSRQVHRFFTLITVFLGLVMMITGFFLKYPQVGNLLKIDVVLMREVHNFLSPLFSFLLFVMVLTGLIMYFTVKR